jgi:hypothetical protein
MIATIKNMNPSIFLLPFIVLSLTNPSHAEGKSPNLLANNPTTPSKNVLQDMPIRDSAYIRLEQYRNRFEMNTQKVFPLFELVGGGIAVAGIFQPEQTRVATILSGVGIATVAYLVRDRSDEERTRLIDSELENIKKLQEQYRLNSAEKEYYAAVAFRKLALEEKQRREKNSLYSIGFAGFSLLLNGTGSAGVTTLVAGGLGIYSWLNKTEIESDYQSYLESSDLSRKPLPLDK